MERDSIVANLGPESGLGYYRIPVSGRQVSVRIHASVIVGLELSLGETTEDLTRGAPVFRGVLLGRKTVREDRTCEIFIDDIKEVPGTPERDDWAPGLSSPREPGHALVPVGCALSASDGAFSAHQSTIAKELFPDSEPAVLLLFQQHPAAPEGDLYLCQSGLVDLDSRTPFRLSLYELLEECTSPAADSGLKLRTARPRPKLRIIIGEGVLKLGGVLVLLLIVVVASALYTFSNQNRDPGPRVAAPGTQGQGLGLAVSRSGTQLHLRWDRDCPAVTGAMSGELSILDSDRARHLALTPNDLRSGSVVYTPLTDDITFVLSVLEPDRANPTETLRVVGLR